MLGDEVLVKFVRWKYGPAAGAARALLRKNKKLTGPFEIRYEDGRHERHPDISEYLVEGKRKSAPITLKFDNEADADLI